MTAPPPRTALPRPRAAGWTSQPERSNLAWLRLMTWISLRLGRTGSRVVLRLITVYFLLFAPAARRASRGYLRRALGRRPGLGDLYRQLFCFASTIHDRVYLLNDRFDLFDIRVQGEEVIRGALASGQGVFLMGAHLGSFEAIRALGRLHGTPPMAMVMYEDNARKINRILTAINPAATSDLVPLGRLDSMLQVRDRLARGHLVGVLGDRTLGNEPGLRVPFLGDPAGFPTGPFRLASLMGCPLIFMTGLYLGGNRYEVHFSRLADFSRAHPEGPQAAVAEALQRYVALIEEQCRNAPYNWFNFFDFWRQPGQGS
jgi:predicted LPLAT superfamily acyltransferase